jgi:N-acetylmuramic acid 6-phosphate (MurNAc-6-P) etherase
VRKIISGKRLPHADVISKVVDKALDKFKASETEWKERRHSLHKQIKDIDIEIERLVAAISAGGDIPVLVTAVKIANDRRTAVSRDLAEVDSQQHSDADYGAAEKGLESTF